jgi:hypothetical protein
MLDASSIFYLAMFTLGSGLVLGAWQYRAVKQSIRIEERSAFVRKRWSVAADSESAFDAGSVIGTMCIDRHALNDVYRRIDAFGLCLHELLTLRWVSMNPLAHHRRAAVGLCTQSSLKT